MNNDYTNIRLLYENNISPVTKIARFFRPSKELEDTIRELADEDNTIETGTEEWYNILSVAYNLSMDRMHDMFVMGKGEFHGDTDKLIKYITDLGYDVV